METDGVHLEDATTSMGCWRYGHFGRVWALKGGLHSAVEVDHSS